MIITVQENLYIYIQFFYIYIIYLDSINFFCINVYKTIYNYNHSITLIYDKAQEFVYIRQFFNSFRLFNKYNINISHLAKNFFCISFYFLQALNKTSKGPVTSSTKDLKAVKRGLFGISGIQKTWPLSINRDRRLFSRFLTVYMPRCTAVLVRKLDRATATAVESND